LCVFSAFYAIKSTKKTFRVSKPNKKIETFVVRFLSLSSVLS
jgi:hypothetical protein